MQVGAKLICCSNRRETHALQDQLTEALCNAGLPLTSFLGFTPKVENPASSNSGGTSNRLASVYSWLLEQDPRRVIESWVIVDKTDMIRGDGRDRVMIWKGSQLRPKQEDKQALDTYKQAVEKGWAGDGLDITKHFVRTNMRKGLSEERAGEVSWWGVGSRWCFVSAVVLICSFDCVSMVVLSLFLFFSFSLFLFLQPKQNTMQPRRKRV